MICIKNNLAGILSIALVVFFLGTFVSHAQTAERNADTDVEALAADSDDDGLSDGSEEGTSGEGEDDTDDIDRANYNNSRSNRSTGVGDGGDLDHDGRTDVEVRADGDESAAGEGRAQNHNSSRSNETEGVSDASDLDDDGDGVPDGAASRDSVVKELDKATPRLAPTKEIDKASPALMLRLGVDQSSPLLYNGVSIRAPHVCTEDGGDCDDEDSTVSPSHSNITIRVSGSEVRGWDPEQKEAIRQRLAAADEMNTANDFGIRVASAALDNGNVVDITTSPEQTEVSYNSRVYLFGFIPKSVTAVARADTNGGVSIDYPWYGFLSRKGDQSMGRALVQRLRDAHNALIAEAE